MDIMMPILQKDNAMHKAKIYMPTNNTFQPTNQMQTTYLDIINFIPTLDLTSYLNTLIGSSQIAQKTMINNLQEFLFQELENNFSGAKWKTEHKPTASQRDSIDIYADYSSFKIIIELDKYRADQVSKKFLSRSALFKDENIIYIAFCYAGTQNMNAKEVIKYFNYADTISIRLENLFAGFIVEDI